MRAAVEEVLARELSQAGIIDEAAGKPVAGGRQTHWFPDAPGFGIRSYATGRRVYIAQVRAGGKARTITICNCLFVTERKAKLIARRVILASMVGEDPAEQRRRARSLPPFDRFLSMYWERASPAWKPSTRYTNLNYRRQHFDGAFLGKGIDVIDEAAVAAWYGQIARNSGTGAATRCLSMLSTMFKRAEEWGLRKDGTNPCRGLRRYRGRKMERHLTASELHRLGEAIAKHQVSFPLHATALRLLVLTGCRLSEILGLTWGEVRRGKVSLNDAKTGPRTVWLGEEARELLAALPRGKASEHVFSAGATEGAVSLKSFWLKVRAEAGLHSVRLHDLRHTFASRAVSLSEPLPMVATLLGHASVQSTARYAHLDDFDMVEAARKVGDELERAILGQKRSIVG